MHRNKQSGVAVLQLLCMTGLPVKGIAGALELHGANVSRWRSDRWPDHAPSDGALAFLRGLLAQRLAELFKAVPAILAVLDQVDAAAVADVARVAAAPAMDCAAFLAERADADRDARREAWRLVRELSAAGVAPETIAQALEAEPVARWELAKPHAPAPAPAPAPARPARPSPRAERPEALEAGADPLTPEAVAALLAPPTSPVYPRCGWSHTLSKALTDTDREQLELLRHTLAVGLQVRPDAVQRALGLACLKREAVPLIAAAVRQLRAAKGATL